MDMIVYFILTYFPGLVSYLAVNQLFLHVHVLWVWLESGAQCGTCAEQPVVKLLCLTMITLQRLFLPLFF